MCSVKCPTTVSDVFRFFPASSRTATRDPADSTTRTRPTSLLFHRRLERATRTAASLQGLRTRTTARALLVSFWSMFEASKMKSDRSRVLFFLFKLVQIQDTCPTCVSSQSLDLSVAAFQVSLRSVERRREVANVPPSFLPFPQIFSPPRPSPASLTVWFQSPGRGHKLPAHGFASILAGRVLNAVCSRFPTSSGLSSLRHVFATKRVATTHQNSFATSEILMPNTARFNFHS